MTTYSTAFGVSTPPFLLYSFMYVMKNTAKVKPFIYFKIVIF